MTEVVNIFDFCKSVILNLNLLKGDNSITSKTFILHICFVCKFENTRMIAIVFVFFSFTFLICLSLHKHDV